MVKYLSLEIKNIKNIKNAVLDLPYIPDVYVLAGTNGSGKSTIMNAFAQVIKNSLQELDATDYDKDSSSVKLSLNGKRNFVKFIKQ